MKPVLLAVLVSGLAGCSAWPDRDRTLEDRHWSESGEMTKSARLFHEAQQRIEAARREVLVADPLAKLKEVRLPLDDDWLEQRLEARYPGLSAEEAVWAILQGRPHRFDFNPLRRPPPLVYPQPGAETVREHLSSITAQANWHWTVDAGVVVIRDIVTRSFSLASQPGAVTAGLGLRNLNETGGSTADNTMSLTLDPYGTEIITAVKNVLGLSADLSTAVPSEDIGQVDPRTTVTLAPSGNLLTVTAAPNAMRQVEQWLSVYNAAVRRTVRIALSLIEVDFRDGQSRDLALHLIRQSARIPLELLMGSSTASLNSDGDLLGGAMQRDGGAALGMIYQRDGSRVQGSQGVIQWLESFGDTTLSYDDTIEVRSNQIASVDLTRTEQYVASIARSPIEGSNQLSTEIEFNELRTGLVIHLQPTVSLEDTHDITLRLGLSRSALVNRQPYNFGSVVGVTHITDDFNRLLSISLKDGEPRLLASLSEASGREDRSRIPVLGRFGLNTAQDQQEREREMVLLITATVVDG